MTGAEAGAALAGTATGDVTSYSRGETRTPDQDINAYTCKQSLMYDRARVTRGKCKHVT